MIANKIAEDVYEICDFITSEEQLEILNLINSFNEEEWFKPNEHYIGEFWIGKSIFIENELIKNINKKIKDLFISSEYIVPIGSINRHRVGENMSPHLDDWIENADSYVRYGIVIYYNDNYEGGEIEYPEILINIKPKQRSLIMHGGKVLHGTLPVLNNSTRYFSTSFIKGSKQNPVVLNKDIFGE